MDAVRKGVCELSPASIDLLFRSLDTLQAMVDAIGPPGTTRRWRLRSWWPQYGQPPLAARRQRPPRRHPGQDLSDQEKEWVEEAAALGLGVLRSLSRWPDAC